MKTCPNCGRENAAGTNWCPECGHSDKFYVFFGRLFAISRIMRRWCLVGFLGVVLIAIGIYKKLLWLKIAGFVLAVPMIWVYFVVLFIFLPAMGLKKLRKWF
ncbi:MAG TPA: hypothetical protein VG754_11115 [Verrucomicrobiae bacterium]|jgi:uncharacterized membrane protein YvbJ|nr:hypothetical protein [Verrucomicrobiae bacterium]